MHLNNTPLPKADFLKKKTKEKKKNVHASRELEFNKYMDRRAGTLSLADRQIENKGRNQSVNVQAQQCITDFTKGRHKEKKRKNPRGAKTEKRKEERCS